ncbi:hypothetical protein A0J61_06180 [Choanephora cucurbitarum]|uniref:DUF8032 domain-containing protein n=1 Tax=Choanephora cucurbitarum TaxID=101091 RepID=A0A1C7NAN7_9FUNG|nr:hypothetical protein A0J61_06180 [Choanephora cucurbitarum]
MATSVTTSTDDIMTLSSATPISETLPHKPGLQLSLQDLLHPTELAENLLESLSNEQLNVIEQAVTKIKQRKLGCSNTQDQDAKNIEQASCHTKSPPYNCQESPNWNPSAVTEIITEPISTSSQDYANNTNDRQLGTGGILQPTLSSLAPSDSQSKEDLIPQQQKTTSNLKSSAKPPATSHTSTSPFLSNHEPTTELKEGVEWVSFVYSHHRTLRRYCIRTDLDKVDIDLLDEEFKKENCVYPRANLPKETYRGNRWSYETECNVLGWKLAYLNLEEIAGKRGLIQRAVDSYRNRYPSMRSRRVARQEKLLKGTLRKRKHRDSTNNNTEEEEHPSKLVKTHHDVHNEKIPKTMLIEDIGSTTKCRIRINIETIALDVIDMTFRKNNCVFPRAIQLTSDMPNLSQRRIDEVKCNEIGWKLCWLNPRQLANKKNLLQRALDLYRNQFAPDIRARKHSPRTPPTFSPPKKEDSIVEKVETNAEDSIQTSNAPRQTIPLTAEALAEQQREFEQLSATTSTSALPAPTTSRRGSTAGQSCYSGTTVTLDFHDYCFSPPPEEDVDMTCEEDTTTTTTTTLHDLSTANSPIFPSVAIFDDLMLATMSSKSMILGSNNLLHDSNESIDSINESINESTGSSYQSTPSPQALLTLSEMYQQAFLMSTASNDSTASAAANELFNANVGSKDDTMFLMTEDTEDSNVIELIARFGTVDAGIGSFTNHTTSMTESSLLSQLF